MTKQTLGHGDAGDVLLPDDAVTQGFALLARRRSGKSNLAGVIEETFCERGDPWVVLDPVSAHWGIRYQDDHGQPGKPSGYDVLIVGGKYGDVALDERGGGALAQILVDTGISCVVDLGAESMSAQQKFVAEFASELLRINETPRHVILEEAHAFVPQVPTFENQKLVLGAMTKMITMGGGKGIGFTLITQRSASIAKAVLEQIDNLIVLRMSGPRDLKAVADWFEHNVGDTRELKRIQESLRGFQPGEAWWLSDTSLERLTVRLRRTYHAGRTPKRGEQMVAPKRVELAQVIGQYRDAAEKRAIAVQEERDLKAENAALKKQLAAQERTMRDAVAREIVPAPCDHEATIATLNARIDVEVEARETFRHHYATAEAKLKAVADVLGEPSTRLPESVNPPSPPRPARSSPTTVIEKRAAKLTAPLARTKPADNIAADSTLTGMEQRILNALAWWEAIGVGTPKKHNVGFVAGYRVSKKIGGAFGSALGALTERGLIVYPMPSCAALTGEGRRYAVAPEHPPTTEGLHDVIFDKLDAMERRVLRVFVDAYPDEIGKQEAGERAGYKIGPKIGGAYGSCLSTLQDLGLIEYPRPGVAIAAALLFPEGVR